MDVFSLLSLLFIRVEVLTVILGLVIVLDGKLGTAVQAAYCYSLVFFVRSISQ